MSLLQYIVNKASALERDTAYIDASGNPTSIKCVLPAVADAVLERLLDYNDLLSMQIICLLQPSFNEYDDFLRRDMGSRRKTGWLRRFGQEIEHIRANLQIFVVHSTSQSTAFVPYKQLKQDLNDVPTIVFSQHFLVLLQSATSVDEENSILAVMVIHFLRELHHLLLYRRPYLSKKSFETLCSQDDVLEKITGGSCAIVEISFEAELASFRQQRLSVCFEGSCDPLVIQDTYVEDLLNWITGTRASGNLAVPFFRPESRFLVGVRDDEATKAMLQSSRIRVQNVHHHIYQVQSPIPANA